MFVSQAFVAASRLMFNAQMRDTCTIYDGSRVNDAYGSPTKPAGQPRVGNAYPVPCSLQEVVRIPIPGQEGERGVSNAEYHLKLPVGTQVATDDEVVVADPSGRSKRLTVSAVYAVGGSKLTMYAHCQSKE